MNYISVITNYVKKGKINGSYLEIMSFKSLASSLFTICFLLKMKVRENIFSKISDAPRNARVLDNQALAEIARQEMEKQKEEARARTAPSAREKRRNWNVDDYEIKTVDGGKRVRAPGMNGFR